jgi:hypothetical protein
MHLSPAYGCTGEVEAEEKKMERGGGRETETDRSREEASEKQR